MPKKHREKDSEVILSDNTLKDKLDTLIDKADKAIIPEIVDRVDTLPFSHKYKTGRLDNSTDNADTYTPSAPSTISHTPSTDPSQPPNTPSEIPSLLASPRSHSAPREWNEEDLGSPLEKRSSLPPILQDLEVPTQKSGPWKSSVDRERWLNVCEVLLSRNVKNAHQISKLTGLTNASALRFVEEIRESWQSDLTPQRVNLRREKLYAENDRIAEFCWNLIGADPTDRNVPQLLKIVGESNTRRARLIGAENITLQTKEIEAREIDANSLSLEVAKKIGISVDVLKRLGDDLSGNMNDDGEE